MAVWLVAGGLYGCGGWDAGQEDSAHDDYRYAHVLHPDYGQSNYVLSSASPDVSRAWAPEQFQEADNLPGTQETHSGNKPAGDRTYTRSSVIVGSPNPDLSLGWTPHQFLEAYNVPLTLPSNKPRGHGIKVAVITAYHSSNLQSDLNKWASYFGMRPISLNIINQAGNTSNNAWALSTNVAVQMINTVSPGATVYVIEARSVSQTDILTAMRTAVSLGVDVVLMPFGTDETPTQGSQADYFRRLQAVWIAPSGTNTRPSFPGTHRDVIAVGGTTLSSVDPFVETAWINSGAGESMFESIPYYQLMFIAGQNRSVPDVAFNADPEYGAHIYSSINGGWFVVGGNSVSTALFTGVVAMANQTRRAAGKMMLTSVYNSRRSLQEYFYVLMSDNKFGGVPDSPLVNDVVDGFAGAGAYPAGRGFDNATGWGSLNVETFIEEMLSAP